MLALIRELKADGMTMVIATHEMAFARDVADEVCFLHEGAILERGAPAHVLDSPARAGDAALPAPPARGGVRVPEVLRTEPQFRLLFFGQVLSLVGDRIMLVALPFAVLEAGGSLGAVGLVVTAQLVPFLVFALIGGVVSDRGDRRRVLIASDVARLVVQLAGGLLLVTGAATPLALGLLAALYGTADAFFQPAFTGLLPQTVSHPGQLQPANALRGLSFSVASIAGPVLAGVLVGAIGAGAAMLFDAGSFAVSVACLLRLRPVATAEGRPRSAAAVRGGDARGLARRPLALVGAGRAGRDLHLLRHRAARRVRARPGDDRRASYGGPGAWAAVVVAFGLGCVLGDVAAAAHPPAPRAARLRASR